MNNVICPHCKKQIELSEAIIHEFQDKIRQEERKNLTATLEKEHALKIAQHEKELRDKLEAEAKEKEKEREEENKNSLLEIEKAKKEKMELLARLEKEQKERSMAEERIKDEALKSASDRFRLEKLEYEKKVNDMQKALEDAQRKGKQGSQQLQGDVLETDLEERLREAFPYDDFKPVPTGIKGGDIKHEIRNKFGNSAGFILWETKRTKTWDKKWLIKLKDDMRAIKANDCILVSEVLPPNVKLYDRIENVWVTSYEFALKLATVVRHGLLNVAIVRSSVLHDDHELRELYNIITSDSFRQMFESRDETISALRQELEADKRSAEKRWRRQGAYIDKLDRNNSQLYGELQAHIPSLKPLSSDRLDTDEDNLFLEKDTQKNLLED